MTSSRPEEPPHDVLAAEGFAMGSFDPLLADDARDVLAADEFAVGGRDPMLHRGPVALPDDPTGIAEPHDVLAAEEFAMPAPPPRSSVTVRTGWNLPLPLLAVAGLALAWALLRRRR
jgi:hypothetical protein